MCYFWLTCESDYAMRPLTLGSMGSKLMSNFYFLLQNQKLCPSRRLTPNWTCMNLKTTSNSVMQLIAWYFLTTPLKSRNAYLLYASNNSFKAQKNFAISCLFIGNKFLWHVQTPKYSLPTLFQLNSLWHDIGEN